MYEKSELSERSAAWNESEKLKRVWPMNPKIKAQQSHRRRNELDQRHQACKVKKKQDELSGRT